MCLAILIVQLVIFIKARFSVSFKSLLDPLDFIQL